MKYLFLIFLLVSCATQSSVSNTVPLNEELTMTLPKFKELGREIEATQLVTATYKDSKFTFEGHLSANKERFLMVGLDSFGRRALEITWTKDEIIYKAASWIPSQLKPENILADIIIIYWPKGAVNKAINPQGKLITGKNKRAVYASGKEIIRIGYKPKAKDIWNGEAHYKNLQWGYSLDIQSVTQ